MTNEVFFRWVAWLLIFAIVAFTLSPIGFRPVTEAPTSLERFAAFVLIGAALCLGYPKYRLGILIILVGIVGLLEIAQDLIPGRHGRLLDGVVKALGAIIGATSTIFIQRYRRVP